MNGVLIFAKTMWKQIVSYTALGMFFGIYYGILASTIFTIFTVGVWELAKWCHYQSRQPHGERFIWRAMSFVLRLILGVWLFSMMWPLGPLALHSAGVGDESRDRLITIYLYASVLTVGWLSIRLRRRLFSEGWQMSQERWNRYLLAFFKIIALDEFGHQRYFYSDEAPPIWLRHEQQAKVRKYVGISVAAVSTVCCLMAWVAYKIVAGTLSSDSMIHRSADLIFALSVSFMFLSVSTRLAWSAYHLYQMVWLQGGATFFSPWEEKLIE